jgi:hypothetical protein
MFNPPRNEYNLSFQKSEAGFDRVNFNCEMVVDPITDYL